MRKLVLSVLFAALSFSSLAQAGYDNQWRFWPEAKLSAETSKYVQSLSGRSFTGQNALALFERVLHPGYYSLTHTEDAKSPRFMRLLIENILDVPVISLGFFKTGFLNSGPNQEGFFSVPETGTPDELSRFKVSVIGPKAGYFYLHTSITLSAYEKFDILTEIDAQSGRLTQVTMQGRLPEQLNRTPRAGAMLKTFQFSGERPAALRPGSCRELWRRFDPGQ